MLKQTLQTLIIKKKKWLVNLKILTSTEDYKCHSQLTVAIFKLC